MKNRYKISIILIAVSLGVISMVWAQRSKPPATPDLSTKTKNSQTSKKVQFTQLEQEFINILLADKRQKRVNITFDPILLQVARERAKDMAKRNYFSHTNPDGYGPNYLVQKAGYKLPDWWGKKKSANYIESISGGRSTAQSTYTGWMNSSGHKTHVLGLKEFYSKQTVVAIGHYYDADATYQHYWVFISAPPQK